MKFSIKPILISAVFTLIAFVSIIGVSCSSDKCKYISCANGGVCNGGACTCPTGYEGTNCETISRLKFTGNWNVFEKGSNSLAAQYPIHILQAESDQLNTYVDIYNFYNNFFRSPIKAYCDGYNLIIPVQRLQGKIVYGQGTFSSSTTYGQYGGITMRYLVQDSVTLVKDDYGYEAPVDFSEPSQWNK